MPVSIERAVPPPVQHGEQPGFWRAAWNHAVHDAPSKAETIGHAAFITFNAGYAGYEIYKMTQPKRTTKQQIWAGLQIAFAILGGAFDAYRLRMAYRLHKAKKNGDPPPFSENDPYRAATYNESTIPRDR